MASCCRLWCQDLTLQHVCSSFDVHLASFQESENSMFLIVLGLQKHQLLKQKDNFVISLLLTFTISDSGSTTPRLSSSTCRRKHSWPQAVTRSTITAIQRSHRIPKSRMSMSCSACIITALESDLQLANGLHIAFQVGSRHCTELLSTAGLHGDEYTRDCEFANALS